MLRRSVLSCLMTLAAAVKQQAGNVYSGGFELLQEELALKRKFRHAECDWLTRLEHVATKDCKWRAGPIMASSPLTAHVLLVAGRTKSTPTKAALTPATRRRAALVVALAVKTDSKATNSSPSATSSPLPTVRSTGYRGLVYAHVKQDERVEAIHELRSFLLPLRPKHA